MGGLFCRVVGGGNGLGSIVFGHGFFSCGAKCTMRLARLIISICKKKIHSFVTAVSLGIHLIKIGVKIRKIRFICTKKIWLDKSEEKIENSLGAGKFVHIEHLGLDSFKSLQKNFVLCSNSDTKTRDVG